MKFLTTFCLLLVVTGARLAIAEDNMEYKHVNGNLTTLEKETFDVLKRRYPGEILDQNLNTLREISESPDYLSFLSRKHPYLKSVKTFGVIDERVVPPKALYFKFFNEQFHIPVLAEIQDDEQWVIHRIVTTKWAFYAIKRSGDAPHYARSNTEQIVRRGLLGRMPLSDPVVERRLGIKPKEKYTQMPKDQEELAVLIFIIQPLFSLAKEHLDEDVRWLRSLFEEHGRSDGMLWAVLQDPILFDRILYTFTTDKTFLKCVYSPIDVEAQVRRRLDERYGKPD